MPESSGSGQNDTVARTVTVWAFGRARECRLPGISQPSERTARWPWRRAELQVARQALSEEIAMADRDGSTPRRRVKPDIPAAWEVATLGLVRPPLVYLASLISGALIHRGLPLLFLPRALAEPIRT